MKKFWIITAITAAVGLSLSLCGVLMGANLNGLYLNGNGLHLNTNNFVSVRETCAEAITDIVIDVSSADVRFVESGEYGFALNSREMSGFEYAFENGVLNISQRKGLSLLMLGIFMEPEYIVVYLPDYARLSAVDIKNKSGNINIGGLSCGTFNLRLTSGNAELSGLEADTAVLKSASGNVRIKGVKTGYVDLRLTSGNLSVSGLCADGIKADITSGNAYIGGEVNGDINVRVTSGDVRMELAGGEWDYSREISVMSGDVYINGSKTGKGSYNVNAGKSMTVKTTSGNVRINFAE